MNTEKQKVTFVSYLVLLIAIVIFSGIFADVKGFWSIFDFTTLSGNFGNVAGAKGNFRGTGGTGARDAFVYSLALTPSVILALGIVRIVDGFGGLAAAEQLINPLFKPLLGLPGYCGLAFITSLQSTDGSAGMTKELFEAGHITDKERTIFTTLQLSADATITNYFSSFAALFPFYTVPIIVPLIVIFVMKVFGANVMRFILLLESRKENKA